MMGVDRIQAIDQGTPYTIIIFYRVATADDVPAGLSALLQGGTAIRKCVGVFDVMPGFPNYSDPEQWVYMFESGALDAWGLTTDFTDRDKAFLNSRLEDESPYLSPNLRVGEPSAKYNCHSAALGLFDVYVDGGSFPRLYKVLEDAGTISSVYYTEAKFVMHGAKCSGTVGCMLGPDIIPLHASYQIAFCQEPTEGCNGQTIYVKVVDKLVGKYGYHGVYRTEPPVPDREYGSDTTKYYKLN